MSVEVPDGIDLGFTYNVGEAAFGRGQQLVKPEAHERFEALSAPGVTRGRLPRLDPVAPKAALGEQACTDAALRRALSDAIGGDEAVLLYPTGTRVQVGQAIVDHMLGGPARRDGREVFFPLIPELIEDPAEIWVGFARSDP